MSPEQKQEWSAAEQIRQQDTWTCLSNPGIQQPALLMVGLPDTGDAETFTLQAGGAQLNQNLGIFYKSHPEDMRATKSQWLEYEL